MPDILSTIQQRDSAFFQMLQAVYAAPNDITFADIVSDNIVSDNITFNHVALADAMPVQGQNSAETASTMTLQRYQGFLFLLYRHPRLRLVPTREIDALLHCYLAEPAHREVWRHLFAGEDLVHVEATETAGTESAFQATKVLFEQEFGVSYGEQAAACDVFRTSAALPR